MNNCKKSIHGVNHSKKQAASILKRAYYLSKILGDKTWYKEHYIQFEEALKDSFGLNQEDIAELRQDVADDTIQFLDGNAFNRSRELDAPVMEAIIDFIIYRLGGESLTKDEWITALKQKRRELEEEFGSDTSLTDEQLIEIVESFESHGLVRTEKLCEMDRLQFIYTINNHLQNLMDLVSDYPSDRLYTRAEWEKVIRRYCDSITREYPLEVFEAFDDVQTLWIIDYLDENECVRH